MNIRYLILGLLTRKPMTGYDVKSSLEDLKWLVDVPSYGSLYPALHGLLEDEMVTLTVVPREGKPSRKVYSITESGSKALQDWLHQPVESDTSQKAFVTRLLLAGSFSQDGLRDYLEQRLGQTSDHRSALERRIVSQPDASGGLESLVVEYGLAIASAEILWLENALARLSDQANAA